MMNTSCMISKKTAYIDFDGTIVDVFQRYYGILNEFLEINSGVKLDFIKYKRLKRLGIKDHIIVEKLTNGLKIDIDKYMVFKREKLESFQWLIKDNLIGKTKDINNTLKDMGYKVVLITQRNNKDNLLKQLYHLNLKEEFDEIVVLKPVKGKNVKLDYIANKYTSDDIIVGDSAVEMEVSEILNIKGYFVETGLFSSETVNINRLVFDQYQSVVDFIKENNN